MGKKNWLMVSLLGWLYPIWPLFTSTPHTISFFMVPCALNSSCAKKFSIKNLNDIVGTHTDVAHAILKRHLASPLVQGIYVTYLGYITYTDYNGEILLPNKESSNSLNVVVTNQIYPVLMRGLTVHHFEIPQETEALFYTYALKQNNKNKNWYWNVIPQQQPERHNIPLNALIILADPNDIEIQSGTFPASSGPHFILPDLFVQGHIDTPFCVLKFLKINRFFEPLIIEKQVKEQSYIQAPKS